MYFCTHSVLTSLLAGAASGAGGMTMVLLFLKAFRLENVGAVWIAKRWSTKQIILSLLAVLVLTDVVTYFYLRTSISLFSGIFLDLFLIANFLFDWAAARGNGN